MLHASRRMNFRQRKIDIDRPLPVIFLKTENDIQELESLNLGDKTLKKLSSTNGYTNLDDNRMHIPTEDELMMQEEEQQIQLLQEQENQRQETMNKVIPVPLVVVKENMEHIDVHFNQPRYFIRYYGKSYDEEKKEINYDLDDEDFDFLEKLNEKLQKETVAATAADITTKEQKAITKLNHCNTHHRHQHHPNHDNEQQYNGHSNVILTDELLEECIDRFEKTTGFSKQLCTLQEAKANYPDLFDKLKLRILTQIYNYWRTKRLKRIFSYNKGMYKTCGKPLLEEFVLPPDIDDVNPALAFRPREHEKVTKKHRKNDADSFDRMKHLSSDLKQLRRLLEVVKLREIKKREFCIITKELILRDLSEFDVNQISTSSNISAYARTNGEPADISAINHKRKLDSMEPELVETSIRKKPKNYKEKKRKEINLSELVKKPLKVPYFSFLIEMKKTGSFEGDEPIDSLNETPSEAPKCYLGRGGRIIFEQSSPSSDSEDENSDIYLSNLIQQEKQCYRRLEISNQKRARHMFAYEDTFGFEEPDEQPEDIVIPNGTGNVIEGQFNSVPKDIEILQANLLQNNSRIKSSNNSNNNADVSATVTTNGVT